MCLALGTLNDVNVVYGLSTSGYRGKQRTNSKLVTCTLQIVLGDGFWIGVYFVVFEDDVHIMKMKEGGR